MNNNNNIIIRKIPKISNEFFQYIQKKIRSNFSLLYENECVVLFTLSHFATLIICFVML